MKKLGTVVGMVCAFALLSLNANAQVEEGQIDMNLGIGLLTFGATGDVGVPPVSFSLDYALKDNITVGGFLGYYSSSQEFPSFGGTYVFNYSYTIVAARGTYHYPLVDNLDTYGSVLLGYTVGSSSIEEPAGANPAFTPAAASVGGVAYGFSVGARYHFTDNIGAFAEVGYGISLLNIGLTYKID
jgi:hypothetical protein